MHPDSLNLPSERLQRLNDKPTASGRYVLYWMQQSQRCLDNHALEFAIARANELQCRLLVAFGLMHDYPEANARHYRFLLEGLFETKEQLERRGIRFVLRFGRPVEVATELAGDAREVVCDRGYLRHQVAWRKELAAAADCAVWQVESDVVIPVEAASPRAEFAARTIRPKIQRLLKRFLVPLVRQPLDRDSLNLRVAGAALNSVDETMRQAQVDDSVPPVSQFRGGPLQAAVRMREFFARDFSRYVEDRARPNRPSCSQLSPYLHFGQISPLTIALAVQRTDGPADCRESLLEELIVRRELACNFVRYTPRYDQFVALPDWARTTLARHQSDRRDPEYSPTELEESRTHDDAWNAAMTEMRLTGCLHNHLRMYWGKKILEWSSSPELAYRTALTLNNRYFLDGRDPNSFANVGWLFGLHDRPFQERAIYGKVRCMVRDGLKRKFDVAEYVRQVRRLARQSATDSANEPPPFELSSS